MNFKLHGSNSTEQMDINRKVGRLGEKIAKDDYRKNGYHTMDTRPGSFFDFVAMRFLNNWKLDIVFVEVKVAKGKVQTISIDSDMQKSQKCIWRSSGRRLCSTVPQ